MISNCDERSTVEDFCSPVRFDTRYVSTSKVITLLQSLCENTSRYPTKMRDVVHDTDIVDLDLDESFENKRLWT